MLNAEDILEKDRVLDSVKLWEKRCSFFKNSVYSSGSTIPISLAEIFHDYEVYQLNKFMSLDNIKNKRVLDIGAGSGRWTKTFAPKVAEVVALEPTNAFSLLKKNTSSYTNVKCIKNSFDDFQSNKNFDLVIISGVLTYIPERYKFDSFLSKALKLVAPEGYLILREPMGRHKKCKFFKVRQTEDDKHKQRRTDMYCEVSRPRSDYDKACLNQDLKLIKLFPNHASVFYHCNTPFMKSFYQKILLKIFNRRHLKLWFLYNACFNKTGAYLRRILNIPQIYIMVYRKSDIVK